MYSQDMRSTTQTSFWLFSLLFQVFIISISYAADTISSGQTLAYPQTLISNNGDFQFGLIDPSNTDTYYMAIWYNRFPSLEATRVWVANRDAPFYLFNSELKLLEDGNLVLVENSTPIWSTNLNSSNTPNTTEAVLLDDGNFVLRSLVPPFQVLWQTFDNTDALLPGGRIGYDTRTNKSQVLTSWKTPSDPAKGVFTLELDPIGDQLVLKNGTRPHWSSGPWNGRSFTHATELNDFLNFRYVKNENESYLTYNVYNSSILYRFVMGASGQFTLFSFDDELLDWTTLWSQPRPQCDVSAYCGAFSVCQQSSRSPLCKCVDGFEPRDPNAWYESDSFNWYGYDTFKGGCVRQASLQCGNKDGFLNMSDSRLIEGRQYLEVRGEDECRLACSRNCSCSAYAYNSNCWIWNGDLPSIQQLYEGGDLYIKLAPSPSGGNNNGSTTWIIVGAVAAVLVLGLAVICVVFKKRPNKKGKKIILNNDDSGSLNENATQDLELPLFDLDTIITATNQFSLSNKIGQGGFGPVYKGVLPTGREIAIKRLSKHSKQGIQEFMNEVVLIAKLQHRNLVRLLGCCIHGEENMLIYEYMPNRSLDSFIFDKRKSIDLNWRLRFDIIVGIARGLLYLHRDSRLTIIHRDLKAGNVLLDSKMNPKISDFGMAKTFRGDQTEQNTIRVVGTYGYMSPEYATDGLFSMKSDVFSFGVLILEIVSGKKNRGFHHASHDLNLLGHTWKLLMDNKALELMDDSIKQSSSASEVLRCIQVGLLCVQKFPEDRPSMAYVVSMLDTDGAILPCPKQPGFYTERSPLDVMSSIPDIVYTVNGVTDTLLEGR